MSKNNGFDLVPRPRNVSLRRGPTREEKVAWADYTREEMAIRIVQVIAFHAGEASAEATGALGKIGLRVTVWADALDQEAESRLRPRHQELFRIFNDQLLAQIYHALMAIDRLTVENVLFIVSHCPQFLALPEEQKGRIRQWIKDIFG